jgi:amidase
MQLKHRWFRLLVLPLLLVSASTSAQDGAKSSFDMMEASIADIHAAYTDGSLTAVQLVQQYLDRIAAYDQSGPKINSIITVNENALAEAAALDRAREQSGLRGPLHGIPVVLKDNINTLDMPTTNGSAILRGVIPPNDATLTRALREAGAIILGKAAMGEFASGSYNSVSGQTINPYNFKRDTGGSSSGSAAAIASNFAVLGVGTDTSTSVRGPSAFNGIVGLRPTTGLISRAGIAPKDLEFDTAGPMARTVTDVARMLEVLAVQDAEDPLSRPVWDEFARHYAVKDGRIQFSQYLDANALRGKRVGVLRNFFGGDPEIEAMAEAALKQLEALGATLVDIQLDADFMARYTGEGETLIRRTADSRFRRDWEQYAATLKGTPATVAEYIELYENKINKSALPATEGTLRLLKASLKTSTEDAAYKQLVSETLPKATADKLAVFEKHGVDVLVFPYETSFARVISNPVYKLEDPSYVDSDVPSPATLAGYNSTGFPGIVVPMGYGTQGLPMALGFMGKPYDDGPLLGYAYAYEQASRKRIPSPLLPPLH